MKLSDFLMKYFDLRVTTQRDVETALTFIKQAKADIEKNTRMAVVARMFFNIHQPTTDEQIIALLSSIDLEGDNGETN